ncbi:MAG TPA: aldehyde dehydrogenase family protein, partial [Pyrinomonadaceae bacterium]|nr:aldehyde dehydrogenase family protein [Pyrinomonadaceae bacterium]
MSAMQTLLSERFHGIVSRDPSTGEEIGRAALMTAPDVAAAVRSARLAQPSWAALSYGERARFILRAREIVLAHTEEIAGLISRETGKPPVEAISMEVVPSLDLMNYFAHNTERLLARQKI